MFNGELKRWYLTFAWNFSLRCVNCEGKRVQWWIPMRADMTRYFNFALYRYISMDREVAWTFILKAIKTSTKKIKWKNAWWCFGPRLSLKHRASCIILIPRHLVEMSVRLLVPSSLPKTVHEFLSERLIKIKLRATFLKNSLAQEGDRKSQCKSNFSTFQHNAI